jgi:large subunit ribosomal protein L11
MKVPVEINIDSKSKTYLIAVSSPPVSELIKKELKLEKGSGSAGSTKIGNLAIEQIILIAKTKMPGMLAKDLKAASKLVIGSCLSSGVLVESKDPREIIQEINKGKYDREIEAEKTEVSKEKSEELEKYFVKIKYQQEEAAKAAAAAKAAEEAAKAAAQAAAGVPAAAAAPGATAVAGAPAPEAAAPTAAKAPAEEAKKEKGKKK